MSITIQGNCDTYSMIDVCVCACVKYTMDMNGERQSFITVVV